MTDDSCGCPCRDCREQDNHRCGLRTCGYTKYLRARRKPKPKPAPFGDVQGALREMLRPAWKRLSKDARARVNEWRRFVEETAELDLETRTERRRTKWREMYG